MEKTRHPLETIALINDFKRYIISKWLIIIIIGISCATIGFLYASYQKPEYIAEITFAPDTDKGGGMSAYAGIAAQFGFDLGTGGGGMFEGENLIEFLRSKLMIEKTLLTTVDFYGKKEVLINSYIRLHQMDKEWEKVADLKAFTFTPDYTEGNRSRDSVLISVSKGISRQLNIEKKDKKLNIISVKMKSNDELFSKLFVETLVENGIQYYVDYRSGKSKQNVAILQRQTDSVYRLMTGGITAVAVTNDLNVNPMRQIVRANVQRKQVDVQINSKIYEELVKQLELSKIALRRETPFIQIIDTPMLPLEKKKLGRLKALLIFGFVGGFLTVLFLGLKYGWRQYVTSATNFSSNSKSTSVSSYRLVDEDTKA